MSRFTTFAMAISILAAPGLLQGAAVAEQATQMTTPASRADLDELRAYLKRNSAIEFETTFAASDAASDDNVKGKAHFVFRRPNMFRIEAEAANESYVYVSDGTSMTIYDTRRKLFSQTPARATLADNMNLVSGLMGYQAHIFDFLAALDQSANSGS